MRTLDPSAIDALLMNKHARVHFVGMGGTGMSAYADYRALSGGVVSGSDRSFDTGHATAQRDAFLARGMQIYPQDGSGVPSVAAIVISAAVEQSVPDYAAALAHDVPIITRKEWLAAHYRTHKCIAITGTSGKSTVTAMVYEALVGAGLNPGLLTGADLRGRLNAGHPGSAAVGTGPLVMEADESDKGIADYTPDIGVILNLQRDHDEPENMLPAMQAFKNNCRAACVISDDEALIPLRNGAVMVGSDLSCVHRYTDVHLTPDGATFLFDGVPVRLPVPGLHNVQNAAAALTAGLLAGADLKKMIAALAAYQGVARRFESVGVKNGVEVIDDYAHNPAKIAAVIRNAQGRGGRVVMWFQPTGFGPTKFMRADLVRMFAGTLRPQDQLYLAPIYYAGGTAAAAGQISSDDLVADIHGLGFHNATVADKEAFLKVVAAKSNAGDCVCITGSRDPTLSQYARQVFEVIPHL
jgi:UDP-N-acetylmuramate-alanine ligase